LGYAGKGIAKKKKRGNERGAWQEQGRRKKGRGGGPTDGRSGKKKEEKHGASLGGKPGKQEKKKKKNPLIHGGKKKKKGRGAPVEEKRTGIRKKVLRKEPPTRWEKAAGIRKNSGEKRGRRSLAWNGQKKRRNARGKIEGGAGRRGGKRNTVCRKSLGRGKRSKKKKETKKGEKGGSRVPEKSLTWKKKKEGPLLKERGGTNVPTKRGMFSEKEGGKGGSRTGAKDQRKRKGRKEGKNASGAKKTKVRDCAGEGGGHGRNTTRGNPEKEKGKIPWW